jgi:hypothetical protein
MCVAVVKNVVIENDFPLLDSISSSTILGLRDPVLQPTYITEPITQPTYFNTEDGHSMFLLKVTTLL